jgi:hypothetical protein
MRPSVRNHTQQVAFNFRLRGPDTHSPRVGDSAANNFQSNIDYEDWAVCGLPRGEGSFSACDRRGECNHADREFHFDEFDELDELVLSSVQRKVAASAAEKQ